jgi:LAO/AO transport system kinase
MLLCEAAGFDVVLVETVGVGQSEHQVGSMVDFFLMLLLPGGGDELQGIKKGILELADAIMINKADGESLSLARKTKLHYQSAMSLLASNDFWKPEVHTCSALEQDGIAECWAMMMRYREQGSQRGALERRRAEQNLQWMSQLTDEMLRQQLSDNAKIREALPIIKEKVSAGMLTPVSAAIDIINMLGPRS